MDNFLKQQAKERGFGDIVRIIYIATILYEGWEMDNKAWIVELSDGKKIALSTSHGSIVEWSKQEAETALMRDLKSAESIREAMQEMWPDYEPPEGRPALRFCSKCKSVMVDAAMYDPEGTIPLATEIDADGRMWACLLCSGKADLKGDKQWTIRVRRRS